MRSSLLALLATALLATPASARPTAPAARHCATRFVTQASVAIPHFTTIQAAVAASRSCDWVLVAPGVYHGKVVIRHGGIHLRGLNRNAVILDGRHKVGNGIVVAKASNVWIENLTVRNFDRKSRNSEIGGNQIWWNGGDESGKIGAHGWWGNYLTTYDTGLRGGYGLFTSNSVTGGWDHVYASGFNDAGIYIGACRDCKAYVRHALVERNALGYSGANSGGHLVIEHSTFRNNAIGMAPASLPDDPPPPQLGTCDAAQNSSPTPTISSTSIQRCTIIRHDVVSSNNLRTAPADSEVGSLPWGAGILLVGDYGDLVAANTVMGNRNLGIAGFENPVPFPPTPETIYFQLSGNRISGNTVGGSGFADLALEGGLFGPKQSVNNCVSDNAAQKTRPTDLSAWSCSLDTTPNSDPATSNAMLGELITLQDQNLHHTQQPQPAPKPLATMPDPCKGAPASPICGG